jgi:deoxyribodipyrimidine photo-lyase
MKNISIFWFRRDLRLEDNTALNLALAKGLPVLPIFIFDDNIISELNVDDPRITFIHKNLESIHKQLKKKQSSLLCFKGTPLEVWQKLTKLYKIQYVFFNEDYEPYAINRDVKIIDLLNKENIKCVTAKDHVIFSKNDVLKDNGQPYTVYTPYKKKWLLKLSDSNIQTSGLQKGQFYRIQQNFCKLDEIGFKESSTKVKDYNIPNSAAYANNRDYPSKDVGSYIGPHLRFGTISIRKLINSLQNHQSNIFLNELIWREFFSQIIYHYPNVVNENFKKKYNTVQWRNNEKEFLKWCKGETGYPIVDAGMKELNTTGYMHNRVRMVTASFLCKHLLIDWRWGEAYFAEKLLDYELASNNGNWQWVAGTGCDAAPYFRVFNPETQLQKFDKNLEYVKKWIPDYNPQTYIEKIVDHKFARERVLSAFKVALSAT